MLWGGPSVPTFKYSTRQPPPGYPHIRAILSLPGRFLEWDDYNNLPFTFDRLGIFIKLHTPYDNWVGIFAFS